MTLRWRPTALGRRSGWLVSALFACALALFPPGVIQRADLLLFDTLEPWFRAPALPTESTVIAIDEATLAAMGRWPWNRAVHAELIDRLTAVGVSSIAMAILFPESAPGDAELAEAMQASGRVILAVAPHAGTATEGMSELLPVDTLRASAAALGHVDVEIDLDGLSRRTYRLAGSGQPRWDALAVAALRHPGSGEPSGLNARVRAGLQQVVQRPLWVRQGELLLPFPDTRGRPEVVSYYTLLSRPEQVRRLEGRTVFIGTTASGIDAGLATPSAAHGGNMPAVEFHARAFEALRSGLTYNSAAAGLALALCLTVISLAALLRPQAGTRGKLLLGGLLLMPPLLSGAVLGAFQLWIPPASAMAGLLLGAALWFLSVLRHTQGSLAQARHDADATLRSIADAVLTIDEDARVVLLNPVAERLTGATLDSARGTPVGELIRDFTDQSAVVVETILGCLKHRQAIRLPEPIAWQAVSGKHHALRLTATPVGGEGEGAVLVFHDVTETLAITARLQHEATHDVLTGLPNRALLLDRLHQALANAQRRGSLVALLFVDLDRFKRINDSLGHYVGDQVLQVVAERLTASVRSGDTVARWGGDEFIILMDHLRDRSAVVAVAGKLLDLLEREVETQGESGLVLSCSIGISVGPADSSDAETLLSMADKAMYRGKLEGGSRYTFYSPEMNTWSRDRLNLEAALRKGLGNDEFELFYQPQIDIRSGRLAGLESLIRWHRPGSGLVRPDLFIAAAEESGLITNIGEWVLNAATHQAARWSADGLVPVPIAVNVSVRQCTDMSVVDTIRHALRDSGMDPRQLKIEVTESTAMHDPERVAELLHRVHALGVGVAVDDFGTGYSSLSLLKRFPISELKIDKSFVIDLAEDNDDAAIVRGTIALAHSLGMRVVAEGVETELQLRFLARHGCNVAQGFLFAQPLPTAEIRHWLRMPPPHAQRAIEGLQHARAGAPGTNGDG